MKIPVYNLKGETVGEAEVSDAIFARPWNPDLVAQALEAQSASQRPILAHTRTRGEVSGGGKKPWRQKGTGRARHGSTRSPIWKGGGVTHGPRNDKVYAKKINKRMKKAALACALSKKVADKELTVVDAFSLQAPKTALLYSALKGFLKKPRGLNISLLLVPGANSKSVFRASANIPKVKSLDPKSLNVQDVLKYKNVIIERPALTEVK